MCNTNHFDLIINEIRFAKILKLVDEKDRDIIQSIYLLMCNSSNGKEMIYKEQLDDITPIYGEARINEILEKWFITVNDMDCDSIYYIPLINLFDFEKCDNNKQ